MTKKRIYNPGFVERYQKPWYVPINHTIKYYGRFSPKGYPGTVHLSFKPLKELIDTITDDTLKEKILILVEEMEDAHDAEVSYYRGGLPSAD